MLHDALKASLCDIKLVEFYVAFVSDRFRVSLPTFSPLPFSLPIPSPRSAALRTYHTNVRRTFAPVCYRQGRKYPNVCRVLDSQQMWFVPPRWCGLGWGKVERGGGGRGVSRRPTSDVGRPTSGIF